MKSLLLVVLLAAAATAAATAAVVSNEVPDVEQMPDMDKGDEVADVGVNVMPEVLVTDVDELTDVFYLSNGAIIPAQTAAVTPRHNLHLGAIAQGDVLVYNSEVKANGVANHFHMRDITVRTNRRVSAIRVNRVGASQNASPSILNGGIGSSFVTIRIQSAPARGYYFIISVYVR